MDNFKLWVMAGRMSVVTSLIIQVSKWSVPVDLELLSPIMIFSTSLGDTGLRLNEHCLFLITSHSFWRGSSPIAGIMSLKSLSLEMKKICMAPATPDGLVSISPSANSLDGEPVFPQDFTFFQIVAELCLAASRFCFSQSLYCCIAVAVLLRVWKLSNHPDLYC